MRSFAIFSPHKILLRYRIKQNEMGVVFSTRGREKRCIQVFSGDTEGKRPLVVDGSIALKWIFKNWDRRYGLD
jgi:hypothetical protein